MGLCLQAWGHSKQIQEGLSGHCVPEYSIGAIYLHTIECGMLCFGTVDPCGNGWDRLSGDIDLRTNECGVLCFGTIDPCGNEWDRLSGDIDLHTNECGMLCFGFHDPHGNGWDRRDGDTGLNASPPNETKGLILAFGVFGTHTFECDMEAPLLRHGEQVPLRALLHVHRRG